jgi:hypothetical protein
VSKIVDSLVQASIDSKNYSGVMLAKMFFNPIYRYSNSYQNIYWDEAGGGELEYTGLGNLVSVSILNESNELQAQTIQLTLSGIPNSVITDAFSTEYQGKPVFLWYATLDKATYAVEGGQDGPVLIFAGLMDYMDIEFGKTATVTLNCTSRLADWERSRGGRFNESYQQTYVDLTDTGFEYVQAIQNVAVSWGSVTLADPGHRDPSYPRCLVYGTKITMADRTTKEIQDIKENEEVLGYDLDSETFVGNKVIEVGTVIKSGTVNYTLDDTVVGTTIEHPIFIKNKGWSCLATDITELGFDFKTEKIEVGDEIMFLEEGSIINKPILAIEENDEITTVYNLYKVANNNNFFANNVLVHNKQDNIYAI